MNIFNVLLIQPLANGLIFFYRILGGNMGLAIIGFSIFLRFMLTPLTKPYMNSMKKMKEVQPQLDKLKEKYKNDKAKLMQAQADFYKEKGVKPGAGCLPYLFQIVILIALFNVFTKILVPDGKGIKTLNTYLYQPLKFGENESLSTTFLYLDMTRPDVFRLTGIPFPVPGPTLILAALFQLVASLMMMPAVRIEEEEAKGTKKKEDDMQVAMQKSSMYTFPLFTIIFGMSFSSGLALYWMVFSAFQVWQQYQTSGWGGLTSLLNRAGLLKLPSKI